MDWGYYGCISFIWHCLCCRCQKQFSVLSLPIQSSTPGLIRITYGALHKSHQNPEGDKTTRYTFSKIIHHGHKAHLINRRRLNHLQFADDIAIVCENKEELGQMFTELEKKSATIRLHINLAKTKVMCKEEPQITIRNQLMEKVQIWAWRGRFYTFNNKKIPMHLSHLYDQCVLPVLTSWAQT